MDGLNKGINIISLDVPYPPNYGGVIDIWNKIDTLKKLKVDIYFHCFYYNRKPNKIIDRICNKTFYYKRNMNFMNIFSKYPFIIKSRQNSELIKNLSLNNYPILFEGLHTCYEIKNSSLANRMKIIRMHNIEYKYYRGLSKFTNNPIKKIYYLLESIKLYKSEKLIKYANLICAISDDEYKFYNNLHNNVIKLPVFHSFCQSSKIKLSQYAIFHGNLSVSENNYIALYLINKIFNKLNFPLIIAGRKPSNRLKKAANI